MIKNLLNSLLVGFLFIQAVSYSQQYGRGLLLNDSLYANSPIAAPLMRGDYHDLPSKFSLKAYAPTPGSQGPYGTCAGWSTAYEARTILEGINEDWSQSKIDSNTFSPSFVYNLIAKGRGCYAGTSLIDALNVLKDKGCEKLKNFAYNCDLKVTNKDEQRAAKYKIIEYREVANFRTDNKSMYVKKSIANSRPVVIAMNCPESFDNAGKVWNPAIKDYKSRAMQGHSITVIGYDDNKFGGAFQIINSWGTDWGDHGFTWIRYTDFNVFCRYAFEVLLKTKLSPNVPDLKGSLKFTEFGGKEMKTTFDGKYFVTQKSYPVGTLFGLKISNDEPAYVYALGSDKTYRVTKLFPLNKRMLAYLPYEQNDVAIPDENHFNMIDTTSGSSYYCFLYAKTSLDIDNIMKKIEDGKGDFEHRLYAAIKNLRVSNKDIKFSSGKEIKFSAKSHGKTVVPIVVEIPKPLREN